MCEKRGKTWNGADPKCGFRANGRFTPDNWNCATLNSLRTAIEDHERWHEDSYYWSGLIPNGGMLVVAHYKNRGCTDGVYRVEDDKVRRATLDEVLAVLETLGVRRG